MMLPADLGLFPFQDHELEHGNQWIRSSAKTWLSILSVPSTADVVDAAEDIDGWKKKAAILISCHRSN